ncbi:MAG: ACP S-malonyltransferase [Thermoanaerobaculia bacterium]|nr:ACP S-malonyltransferase [Thermoanaerobaculia bacterium]
MRTAFVFPGQGSQSVGMGRAWAERSAAAAAVFERADEVLGFPLSRLCWEGPAEELQLTANTQPAILTVSVAIHAALIEHGLEAVAGAGHSLGEYSALVAAGSLELDDALRLVRRRGELMQEAVPVGEGAMAAVLGLEAGEVEAVAAAAAGDEVCAVANYNSPVQTVLAGTSAAIERAIALAKERGARRAIPLPVSAPFHSPLMAPAREGMTPLLESTEIAAPRLPVVTNVDAVEADSGAAVRDALVRQIDRPVRWVESVRRLVDGYGVARFVEVGPGSVLCGLVRRIEPGAETVAAAEPEILDEIGTSSE